MQQLLKQLHSIIREITFFHKALLFMTILALGAIFCYLITTHTPSLVPLHLAGKIGENEAAEIRSYLLDKQIVFQEKKKGQFLVPKEKVQVVHQELKSNGVFKKKEKSGFELFDSTTWLKGEKELQVLEIRALKEQLEKDITAFENISGAHVILDIPPQRSFGNSAFKPKASVILTLTPESYLSSSELQAIVHHLTGAIRGLEPQMVAISDTSGKLYQVIDPSAKPFSSPFLQSSMEEEIQHKIERLLTKIYGTKNFFLDVQLRKEALSIFLFLNKEESFVREEIHLATLIETLLESYKLEPHIKIETLEFHRKPPEVSSKSVPEVPAYNFTKVIYYTLFSCVAISLFYFWKKSRKKPAPSQEKPPHNLEAVMGKINLETLASLIQDQPPETIAHMLSYLEKSRRELLLALLPSSIREEVLKHAT